LTTENINREIIGYIREFKDNLKEDLDKSGAVLYSNYYTLKPGKLYILGFNPGGDLKDKVLKLQTIKNDLDSPKKWDKCYSEYT